MKIVIDDISVPSGNRLIRMHWAVRRKLIKDWYWLILAGAKGTDKVNYYRYVKITGIVKRRMDDTNFRTACDKLINDNLKKLLLIEDDFLTKCSFDYIQEVAKGKKPQITIELFDNKGGE